MNTPTNINAVTPSTVGAETRVQVPEIRLPTNVPTAGGCRKTAVVSSIALAFISSAFASYCLADPTVLGFICTGNPNALGGFYAVVATAMTILAGIQVRR